MLVEPVQGWRISANGFEAMQCTRMQLKGKQLPTQTFYIILQSRLALLKFVYIKI